MIRILCINDNWSAEFLQILANVNGVAPKMLEEYEASGEATCTCGCDISGYIIPECDSTESCIFAKPHFIEMEINSNEVPELAEIEELPGFQVFENPNVIHIR